MSMTVKDGVKLGIGWYLFKLVGGTAAMALVLGFFYCIGSRGN